MSFEYNEIFTKEKLDLYLKELASRNHFDRWSCNRSTLQFQRDDD